MAPPNNIRQNEPIEFNQDDDHGLLQFKTQLGPCFSYLQLKILKIINWTLKTTFFSSHNMHTIWKPKDLLQHWICLTDSVQHGLINLYYCSQIIKDSILPFMPKKLQYHLMAEHFLLLCIHMLDALALLQLIGVCTKHPTISINNLKMKKGREK